MPYYVLLLLLLILLLLLGVYVFYWQQVSTARRGCGTYIPTSIYGRNSWRTPYHHFRTTSYHTESLSSRKVFFPDP